jgi:polyisoprenoid-binding protein YceI
MSTYKIDAAHSDATFKVRHLMITGVTGNFTKFDGELSADKDDFSDAKISFNADVNSINTNNADRDTHLKSADFFDAEKFPSITFVSTEFKKGSGNEYQLTGNLTVKDVTKQVELTAEFLGTATDPWGNTKIGFEISGKINRTEMGLTWNAALETGGVMVSEEVKLHFNIQLAKQ